MASCPTTIMLLPFANSATFFLFSSERQLSTAATQQIVLLPSHEMYSRALFICSIQISSLRKIKRTLEGSSLGRISHSHNDLSICVIPKTEVSIIKQIDITVHIFVTSIYNMKRLENSTCTTCKALDSRQFIPA